MPHADGDGDANDADSLLVTLHVVAAQPDFCAISISYVFLRASRCVAACPWLLASGPDRKGAVGRTMGMGRRTRSRRLG